MNLDIIKTIDAITPLEIISQNNDRISIIYKNSDILKIILFKKDNYYLIKLSFLNNFEIISPALSKNKNSYFIDLKKLPLSPDGVKDFRYIIFKLNSSYLIVKVDIINDYSIECDKKNKNEINLFFKDINQVKLSIEIYDVLEEFYKKINTDLEPTPILLSGIGLIYDYKKIQGSDFRFSELKSELKIDNIYFVLKNWEDNKNTVKTNIQTEGIDGFLHKLAINNIKYIFHYDNCTALNLTDKFDVVKMRNGKIPSINKRAYIDYFSKDGETKLFEIYKKFISLNSRGIFLNPAYFYFSDKDVYEKSIVKSGDGLNQYMNNVLHGFKKINEILNQLKASCKNNEIVFFSNVLSKSLGNSVFIDEFPEDIFDGLLLIESFYRQGFTNFGFCINEKAFHSKNLLKTFILLLFVPSIFIDIDIIINRIIKEISLKNYFTKLYEDRFNLRVIIDNSLLDFKKNGNLPFSIYRIKNKAVGFFLGKSIFCSLSETHLFDSIITLPEGLWYSLSDKIIIDGGLTFSYKGNKNNYHLFQRADTIFLAGNNMSQNALIKSNAAVFNIFPSLGKDNTGSFKTQIIERLNINDTPSEINHSFILKKNKNALVLNYNSKQKENIDRTFLFHCIINEKLVDKIIINDKKMIFKREKDASFIEFSHINKNNLINIEIFFK